MNLPAFSKCKYQELISWYPNYYNETSNWEVWEFFLRSEINKSKDQARILIRVIHLILSSRITIEK
jgi:hypothetical protein